MAQFFIYLENDTPRADPHPLHLPASSALSHHFLEFNRKRGTGKEVHRSIVER